MDPTFIFLRFSLTFLNKHMNSTTLSVCVCTSTHTYTLKQSHHHTEFTSETFLVSDPLETHRDDKNYSVNGVVLIVTYYREEDPI